MTARDPSPAWVTMCQDLYNVKYKSLPKLYDSGIKFFKELVYDVVKSDVVASMLAMINQKREGYKQQYYAVKSQVRARQPPQCLVGNIGDGGSGRPASGHPWDSG
jgi:hypothetical protein